MTTRRTSTSDLPTFTTIPNWHLSLPPNRPRHAWPDNLVIWLKDQFNRLSSSITTHAPYTPFGSDKALLFDLLTHPLSLHAQTTFWTVYLLLLLVFSPHYPEGWSAALVAGVVSAVGYLLVAKREERVGGRGWWGMTVGYWGVR
ncbi:hypothetical protein BJ508DRAFT_329009, partial [Ascobolus immersus RN42]